MVDIKRIAGLLWVFIPPLVLSALIHMADPDIDGWKGLASYSVLLMVFLLGVLVAVCVLFCLAVHLKAGRMAFFGASSLFAVISGGILAYFGSGATTILGLLWTFVGSSWLVFAVVILAVIPAVALGWPASPRDSAGYVG